MQSEVFSFQGLLGSISFSAAHQAIQLKLFEPSVEKPPEKFIGKLALLERSVLVSLPCPTSAIQIAAYGAYLDNRTGLLEFFLLLQSEILDSCAVTLYDLWKIRWAQGKPILVSSFQLNSPATRIFLH
eukprot:Sdes_comp18854_c0_seq1m9278